jgi:electron transport complex protein RnfG
VTDHLHMHASPSAGPPSGGLAMIRTLVTVSAISGLLIVAVFQWTLPIIKASRAQALREAVFQVIPGVSRVTTFRLQDDGTLARLEGEDERAAKVYAGYSDAGKLAGVAIPAQGQGYQDVIKIIYGYDPGRQAIVGMKVLESKETPGLGDKIGKDPAFLANFDALDVTLGDDGQALRHAIEVVKAGAKQQPWQIDAITGATISSKAVGRMLGESSRAWLPIIQRNLPTLAAQEGR